MDPNGKLSARGDGKGEHPVFKTALDVVNNIIEQINPTKEGNPLQAFPESFVSDFALCHSLFVTTEDLLDLLSEECENAFKTNDNSRHEYILLFASATCRMLHDLRYHSALRQFVAFVQRHGAVDSYTKPNGRKKVPELVKCTDTPDAKLQASKAPEKERRKFVRTNSMNRPSFLHFSTEIFAHRLTAIFSRKIHEVGAEEYLAKDHGNPRMAPHLTHFINASNKLTGWVTSKVLGYYNVWNTVDAIVKFVHIINNLVALNNFHCAAMIIYSLTSVAVKKLSRVWELLKLSRRTEYDQFRDLTSLLFSPPNYKGYNKKLKAINSKLDPCLPIIPVILGNIKRLHEAIALDKKIIKWDSMEHMATQIRQILRWSRPFKVQENNVYDNIIFDIVTAEPWCKDRSALIAIAKMRNSKFTKDQGLGSQEYRPRSSTGSPKRLSRIRRHKKSISQAGSLNTLSRMAPFIFPEKKRRIEPELSLNMSDRDWQAFRATRT